MKNFILILTILISYSATSQNVARIYNQNVERGKAGDVVNLFNNFFDQEYKSGGVMLQSVSFRNDITHRIVFYGDPSNWGSVEERGDGEWDNFLGQLYNLTYPNAQDNAMITILSWSSDNNTEDYNTGKIWDITVENPSKMKAAFDRILEKNQKILDGRSLGLVQYDAGGPDGATHSIIMYGKDMNDITLKEREIRSTKQFAEYISNRGNVEYVKTYLINVVSRF
jgi:hypothetical protein